MSAEEGVRQFLARFREKPVKVWLNNPVKIRLGGRFGFFFLVGEGERGVRGARRGVGVGRFFIDKPRGGFQEGGRRAGSVCVCVVRRIGEFFWGGGAKYFFRGRNVHQADQSMCFQRCKVYPDSAGKVNLVKSVRPLLRPTPVAQHRLWVTIGCSIPGPSFGQHCADNHRSCGAGSWQTEGGVGM